MNEELLAVGVQSLKERYHYWTNAIREIKHSQHDHSGLIENMFRMRHETYRCTNIILEAVGLARWEPTPEEHQTDE